MTTVINNVKKGSIISKLEENKMENNAKKSNREVVSKFMELTGCDNLCLFGGAAIDRYLNPDCEIMDYDIAIRDPEVYARSIERLREANCEVGIPRAAAFTVATVVKHKDLGVFDLNCMKIEQNGIFNLEKFYIEYSPEYPMGRAVDTYGAVPGLRTGQIKLASNPAEEKAYDLLRRFSVLAGKYDFPLERGGKNEQTIAAIEKRIKETPCNSKNEHSRIRCLARFLGAAFRRNKQAEYFEKMGQTGLYSYGFPALQAVMENKDFIEELSVYPAKDKKELIEKMYAYSADKEAFVAEISLLSKRERDREDPRVFDKIVEYSAQKTSIKRLNESIIEPLLKFKLSRGY